MKAATALFLRLVLGPSHACFLLSPAPSPEPSDLAIGSRALDDWPEVALSLHPWRDPARPWLVAAAVNGGPTYAAAGLIATIDTAGVLRLIDSGREVAVRLSAIELRVERLAAAPPGGWDRGRRRACLLWSRAGVAR